jgi:hypothetical protein
MADRTILLFAPTAAGKTAQIGELAEYIWKTEKKKTRIYSNDPGGVAAIQAHINVGIVEHISLVGLNPWCFEWASEGLTPPLGRRGKWVSDTPSDDSIGLWAYEGITSVGTGMMQDLALQASRGKNIGGGLAIKVENYIEAADETITVGSNNQAHYGIVQNRLTDLVWRSFNRTGTVVWTALDNRGTDPETGAAIVGPMAPGKALTSTIPSWFNLVVHMTVKPGSPGKPPIREMYLAPHQDASTGGMQMAMANGRLPRGSDVPTLISPASMAKVMELFKGQTENEEVRLRKELSL